jgi:enoyl-CoA hydratase/carnithine racemase
MGLVHRVLPVAALADGVAKLAETLAGNAPLTIRAMKRCIAEAVKDPEARDVAAATALVEACFDSADYVEGRRAFMEKRRPKFSGR